MTTYKLLYFTTFHMRVYLNLMSRTRLVSALILHPRRQHDGNCRRCPYRLPQCPSKTQFFTAMIAVPFSHHCRRALPPENKLYSTLSKFENKPKSPDVCVNFTQRNRPQFHARKALFFACENKILETSNARGRFGPER